jgi:hypothetical protein
MRNQDWPLRLQTLLDDARTQEFLWGRWDCCQWAGLCVEAQTGVNPIEHIRGRYKTSIGAMRVLRREFGVASIRDAVTQMMGDPVPPRLAGRGDLALVDINGIASVGVINLSGEKVAAIGLHGLEHVPLTAAVTAWKV